jgi:hypothetical protein
MAVKLSAAMAPVGPVVLIGRPADLANQNQRKQIHQKFCPWLVAQAGTKDFRFTPKSGHTAPLSLFGCPFKNPPPKGGVKKLWAISVRTLKTGAGSKYIDRSRG